MAAEHGFTGVWVAEHHAARRYFPPPLQVLTWAAARFPGLWLGTCVALPTVHRPLHFAESVATLQLLSGGRLRLGVGSGFRLAEFDAVGADVETRLAMLRESMDVVEALLAGERVTFEVGPWSGRDASVSAHPDVPPPVLWATQTSAGVRVASRRASGLIPNLMAGLDGQLALLDEFDARTGRTAALRPAIVDVVVAEDRSIAVDRAIRSLGQEYGSFKHWPSLVTGLAEFGRDPAGAIDQIRHLAVIGTVEDFLTTAHRLAASEVTQLVMRLQFTATPHAEVLEAIERLGTAWRSHQLSER
jgi:alkanesulfonate monooxygenase SsuD/methylene tetrahydromethanopterin reductase-like flavin-dependent oxidoreductase (luciferase family)